MKWRGETEEQRLRRETTPHLRFMWFPQQTVTGEVVWLEFVWRKLYRGPNMREWWEYGVEREDLRDPVRPPPPSGMGHVRSGGSK